MMRTPMNRAEMIRRLKALAGAPSAQAKPWYRITNDADGPARVDVFDEIGGSWFSDGVTASGFTEALAAIPMSRAIECHINSPGGDVFDGLAIYNALAARPGPVTTIVDGLAASAASFIAQAGKERVVSPGSMMMIHDASGLCIGNAADMRELADLLDLVSGNLADIYAAHSGQPAAGWRDAMRAEKWYKAADAVSAGLADRLAERPAPEGATARHDLSVFAAVPDWVRAADGGGGADGGDGKQPCKTCKGKGRLPHPATGKNGKTCPECGGTGTYDPDSGGDDDEPDEDGQGEDMGMDDRSRRWVRDADFGQLRTAVRDVLGDPAVRRVLGIESMPLANKAIPVHHTATVDAAWDGPAAVAAMPAEYADLHYCHAWQSADADSSSHTPGDDDADDKKGAFKFPHHAKDGGPANVNACSNGLARLSGADIPDGDRAGVEAHLRAHLKDAGHGEEDDGADSRAHQHAARAGLADIRSALKGARA